MIQHNPRNWRVLAEGTPVQRHAFEILSDTAVFDLLKPHDPAHVSTIANDIDIVGSDIDIVCSCVDFSALTSVLTEAFKEFSQFNVSVRENRGVKALVATIPTEIPIEIYAEETATERQLGYRHYLIACRVLDLLGPEAHDDIRELKRDGLKTEPAFARYLGLAGDPYQSFLKLEEVSDAGLRMLRAAQIHK